MLDLKPNFKTIQSGIESNKLNAIVGLRKVRRTASGKNEYE